MTTRGVIAFYVAVVAILGSMLVGIGPATASSRFTVTVSHTTLISRHALTVTARSNVACQWGIRWAGQTRVRRNSKLLVAHFVAPRVTKAKKYRLLAVCNYRAIPAPSGRPANDVQANRHRAPMSVEAVVPLHWFRTITITVVPPAPISKPSTAPGLPDTGGPMGWMVVVAFGLLLTGTALVRVSRRSVAQLARGPLTAAD